MKISYNLDNSNTVYSLLNEKTIHFPSSLLNDHISLPIWGFSSRTKMSMKLIRPAGVIIIGESSSIKISLDAREQATADNSSTHTRISISTIPRDLFTVTVSQRWKKGVMFGRSNEILARFYVFCTK